MCVSGWGRGGINKLMKLSEEPARTVPDGVGFWHHFQSAETAKEGSSHNYAEINCSSRQHPRLAGLAAGSFAGVACLLCEQ